MTPFHHQSEAQHPKSSAIHKYAGRLPHLMEIDHYGEMLVGCIHCNRWGHPGDETLVMELLESDLEALKANQRQ